MPRFLQLLLIPLLLLTAMHSRGQSLSASKVYPRFAIGVTGIYATIENLEVTVSDVAAGSPADGLGFASGDVLTAVNSNTLLALTDPRVPLGQAITAAEASDGQLTFGVRNKTDITLTIPVIGTYAGNWPAGNCPKSAHIVNELVAYIVASQQADGSYSLEGQASGQDIGQYLASLFLLSTGDDSYLPNVQAHVQSLLPSITSNTTTSCWVLGYQGILLGEYYLRTGDASVLDALKALCDRAVEQQIGGGWSHGADPNPGYVQSGIMSSAGVPVLTTLILADECGVEFNRDAYKKALKLMYRMVGHGCVPYGNHRPELSWSNTNGRNAMLACAFTLLDDPTSGDTPHYQSAAKHLAMLVADSYHQPEFGHTGGGFNVMWRGMGSTHVPDEKDSHRQQQMQQLAWYYDLCRQPDGGFIMLPTPPNNTRYSGFGKVWASGSIGLTYTAPRKALRILGANRTAYSSSNTPPEFTWGNAADRDYLSYEHADGFTGTDAPHEVYQKLLGTDRLNTSVSYCENYLQHYSLMVRWWASSLLKDLNTTEAHEALLRAANHSDRRVRRAAFDALSGYSGWSRPMPKKIPSSVVSANFLPAITSTLQDPNSAYWDIDGALFALSNAEPEDIRAMLTEIDTHLQSDEWWLRESAFWALTGLSNTITGTEFARLSQAYARADSVFETGSMHAGFNQILSSGHDAFNFGQRALSIRDLATTFNTPNTGYESWNPVNYHTLYRGQAAHRAMMILQSFDPSVYRFIVPDIVHFLKDWQPGYQHNDYLMTGSPWQDGFLSVLNDHLGAYGRPIVEELETILAVYDTFPYGTAAQKLAIQDTVDTWRDTYDAHAPPSLPGEIATLLTYYDFEGDFLDAPSTGNTSDDLNNSSVSFASDSPTGHGTQSASFNGSASLVTSAYSEDLSPDSKAYTVMFWIKSSDNPELSKILSTHLKPAGGDAAQPAWSIDGSPQGLSLGFGGGGENQSSEWQSPTANLGGDGQWHHVAFVVANSAHPDYSGDAYGRTFVDGIEVGLDAKTTPWTDHLLGNTEGALTIGTNFNGQLDDIALYSGVVADRDIAAIAAGSQSPDAELQGPPPATELAPILGSPSVAASADSGAAVGCNLEQASAKVYLVWAHEDQGESSLNAWASASGGGWRDLGDHSLDTSFLELLTGLDSDRTYAFRFLAINDNGQDWSEAGSFTTPNSGRGETLRVFLLLGQSNMQGQAFTYDTENTANWNVPTMEFLLSGTPAATNYLNNLPFDFKNSLNADWLNPRSDVWAVHYDSQTGLTMDVQPTKDASSIYNGAGPLSPGFGVSTTFGSTFGAELVMGQRLGDYTGDPVFLFKSSRGGTTLGNDWRPPNAVTARGGEVGINYTQSINNFISFLDQLDADLADDGVLNDYNGATRYEISGVFWFQGWNEQYNDAPYTGSQLQAEYKDNLVDLIHSIRSADARIPDDLAMIIGESSDQHETLNTARIAAVDQLNTELPGSSAYFNTDNMIGTNYGDNENGVPFSTGWGYHFNARAEHFLEIGWKAAGSVLDLDLVDQAPEFFLGQPRQTALLFNQVDFDIAISGNADTIKIVWDTVDRGGTSLSDWSNTLDIPAWSGGNGELNLTLPNLTENTNYVLRVYAVSDIGGMPAWSSPLLFQTPYEDPPPVLGTPTFSNSSRDGMTITCDLLKSFADSIQIVWAEEDQGESDLSTWMSATGGGAMQFGPVERLGTVNEMISGMESGKIYHLRVRGENHQGVGWSPVIRVETKRMPWDLLLKVYYDFEPDGDPYNDTAGIYADDLAQQLNPLLSSDVSTNAKGSTQSVYFNGNSSLSTGAYSTDLGPDEDAMTIMFWIKGSDDQQENTATRVIFPARLPNRQYTTTRYWVIQGPGNNGSNGTKLDLRTRDYDLNALATSPAAKNGDIGALANTGQTEVWHHVTFVWSNSGDPNGDGAYTETYLDGVSVGIASASTACDGINIANADAQMIIGAENTINTTRDFTGYIDDFALFAGIVHPDEIAAVANGSKKPTEVTATRPIRFDTWIAGFDIDGGTVFNNDDDRDGIPNGVEYALGTDPGSFTAQLAPSTSNDGKLIYRHYQNLIATDGVTLSYEWSTDLKTFHKSGETVDGLTVTITPETNSPVLGTTTVTAETNSPTPNLFLRTSVQQN
ncbi:hypothetical protein Rhal01_01167 [Rubritalea halochordaticola]|uniref:Fibronectin type-III domain-containing protein n=1 Tax=Rubritalea halochordaticola TaxID=714537 RepID=A0ABP9UXN0_9BACT